MEIKFSKYHGLGNDFIILSDYNEVFDYSSLAKKVCNRNTGIGADGLIVVQTEPLTMHFYNQDGSIASMCGNGLRCFSRYVVDNNIINEKMFTVNTRSGRYNIEIVDDLVKVEFSNISFDPKVMEINTNKDKFLNEKVLNSFTYAVFTGTSHLVVFVESFNDITEEYAKKLHEHKIFKAKINVNFVRVVNPTKLEIKTYERGVGFTLACGTGSVASFKIARMLKRIESIINVEYQVGNLSLEDKNDKIYFLGPAKHIASGIYYY